MSPMPSKGSKSCSLRALICAHYREQSLPPERLAALLSRIEAAPETGSTGAGGTGGGGRPPRRRLRRAVVAAGLLLALVGGGWLAIGLPGLTGGTAGKAGAITRAIAVEAATTHRQQHAPEVHPNRMAECGRLLGRLDFQPRRPRHPAALGLSLEGARYCTVQGRLAVQAMLRDARGAGYSLFQVRVDEALARARPGEQQIGDLNVGVWEEDELLMVLVGPSR